MRPECAPASEAPCCEPLTAAVISPGDARALARTFKALADPARLRLISLVAASEAGEACVCDLIDPVGLSQPTVSHHLKVLADAGLLKRSKRGVWAYYALVPDALDLVSQFLVPASESSSPHVGGRAEAMARA